MKRFPVLQQMVRQFGIEDGRLRLEWISASEGDVFVRVVNGMVEQVRALGPLAWKRRAGIEDRMQSPHAG